MVTYVHYTAAKDVKFVPVFSSASRDTQLRGYNVDRTHHFRGDLDSPD